MYDVLLSGTRSGSNRKAKRVLLSSGISFLTSTWCLSLVDCLAGVLRRSVLLSSSKPIRKPYLHLFNADDNLRTSTVFPT
jgi:hypothetical protein